MSILPSLLVFSNPFQAIAPSSTTNLAISTASINTSTNDLVHLSSELGPKTMNSRRANETKILVSGRIMTKGCCADEETETKCNLACNEHITELPTAPNYSSALAV